jgi:hypothetical protein
MKTDQFSGCGRVTILGVPNTNIRYIWLTFFEGPNNVGYSEVSCKLSVGIRQPNGLGIYFGFFDYGHGLRA